MNIEHQQIHENNPTECRPEYWAGYSKAEKSKVLMAMCYLIFNNYACPKCMQMFNSLYDVITQYEQPLADRGNSQSRDCINVSKAIRGEGWPNKQYRLWGRTWLTDDTGNVDIQTLRY